MGRTHLATVDLDGTHIETYLWSRTVTADGEAIRDSYGSVLVEDTFMMPARVLAQALDISVSWDNGTPTSTLTAA